MTPRMHAVPLVLLLLLLAGECRPSGSAAGSAGDRAVQHESPLGGMAAGRLLLEEATGAATKATPAAKPASQNLTTRRQAYTFQVDLLLTNRKRCSDMSTRVKGVFRRRVKAVLTGLAGGDAQLFPSFASVRCTDPARGQNKRVRLVLRSAPVTDSTAKAMLDGMRRKGVADVVASVSQRLPKADQSLWAPKFLTYKSAKASSVCVREFTAAASGGAGCPADKSIWRPTAEVQATECRSFGSCDAASCACPAPQLCLDGSCKLPECSDADTCGVGSCQCPASAPSCIDGKCSLPRCGATCSSKCACPAPTTQCGSDGTCQLPTCGATCSSACSCPGSKSECREGKCQVPLPTCGANEFCNTGACSCKAPLSMCDVVCKLPICGANCTASCVCPSPTSFCDNGTCKLPTCGASDFCNTGACTCRSPRGKCDGICQTSTCAANERCSNDACDCPPPMICDGTCKLPSCSEGQTCGSATCACASPRSCINGVCRLPTCAGTACSPGTCSCPAPRTLCEGGTCKLPVCAPSGGVCTAGVGQTCRCIAPSTCDAEGKCQYPVCQTGGQCGGITPFCRCVEPKVCDEDGTCQLPRCKIGEGTCTSSATSPQTCRCLGGAPGANYICDPASRICRLPVCNVGDGKCSGDGQTCRCLGSTTSGQLVCDAESNTCQLPTCKTGEGKCSGEGQTCRCGGGGTDGGCNPATNTCLPPVCKIGDQKCSPATPGGQACRCTGSSPAGSYVCDAETNTCKLPQCQAGASKCDPGGEGQECECASPNECDSASNTCLLPRCTGANPSARCDPSQTNQACRCEGTTPYGRLICDPLSNTCKLPACIPGDPNTKCDPSQPNQACSCAESTAYGDSWCDASSNMCQLPKCKLEDPGSRCSPDLGGQNCACVGSTTSGSYVCDASTNTCRLPVCGGKPGVCTEGDSKQTCRCLAPNACNDGTCGLKQCNLGDALCDPKFPDTQQCSCFGSNSYGNYQCDPVNNVCTLPKCALGDGQCLPGPSQTCFCSGENAWGFFQCGPDDKCQLPFCQPGHYCGPTSCQCASDMTCDTGKCKDDKTLLLALKASFDNGAMVLASWTESSQPCMPGHSGPSTANWLGVTCSNGRVSEIVLAATSPQLSRTGASPPGGALPSSLRKLDVSGNLLSGSIPTSWKLNEGLTQLNLGGNQLSGSIPGPDTWPLPSTLAFLGLSQHPGLVGPLPANWGLPNGITVELFGCSLSGKVPQMPGTWDVKIIVRPGNQLLTCRVSPPFYLDSALLSQPWCNGAYGYQGCLAVLPC